MTREQAINYLYSSGYSDEQVDGIVKAFEPTTNNDLAVEEHKGEVMDFPNTFDEFVKDYGFKDKEEVYTNGSELIQVYRVKQWLEHINETTTMIDKSNFSQEQYKADLQSAYDCGVASVKQEPRWIPVREKLPNDRDWCLGIFKEPDTGWINPLPYSCDYVGRETKATTKEYWILHGFTDRDEHIDYYFNLECVAWMPLPSRSSIDALIMREVEE